MLPFVSVCLQPAGLDDRRCQIRDWPLPRVWQTDSEWLLSGPGWYHTSNYWQAAMPPHGQEKPAALEAASQTFTLELLLPEPHGQSLLIWVITWSHPGLRNFVTVTENKSYKLWGQRQLAPVTAVNKSATRWWKVMSNTTKVLCAWLSLWRTYLQISRFPLQGETNAKIFFWHGLI